MYILLLQRSRSLRDTGGEYIDMSMRSKNGLLSLSFLENREEPSGKQERILKLGF